MIIIDKFQVAKRKFKLKKPLVLDIWLTSEINRKYDLSLPETSQPLGVVLDFGGTESYKNVFVTEYCDHYLTHAIWKIMATLFDEAHDPGNDSPQDRWFRENMTELKGE